MPEDSKSQSRLELRLELRLKLRRLNNMTATRGHEQAPNVQKVSPRKIWRNPLFSVALLTSLLLLVLLSIPTLTLDGPNSRRNAREAVAVGNLHRIATLQNEYAVAHPTKGFACELPLLKLTPVTRNDYDADAFLLSSDHAGYRISLIGCGPDPAGMVRRYQITAVPLEPGRSGVRAFCADQAGVLWYDPSGSAANCLATRRTIN